MEQKRDHSKHIFRVIRDYLTLTIAMIIGSFGLTFFLLPHQITMGGIVGISSILYWGVGVPVQHSYLLLNSLLLVIALKVLGWRFCIKTIYGVLVFTVVTGVLTPFGAQAHMLADQKFMACIVGGVFMGVSVGLGLSSGGSTGGSDLVASIIHKYRDVSLGHVILLFDLTVITSGYVVLRNWEKVLYGYVLLFIIAFCVDYIVNSLRQSVQFFIISDKYREIGEAINKYAHRGCSTLYGSGFYSKKSINVIYCIAKKSESRFIFDLIDEVDPDAFVAQSAVIGVYGQGFDRIRKGRRAKALSSEQLRHLDGE